MLKAVVFDMDDTLLSINLSAFIAVFARDEAALLADIARKSQLSMFATFGAALYALNNGERNDDDTNLAFFQKQVERRCGVPLSDPVIADVLTYYEREILPGKNDGIINARPREGAREAIDAVASRGLRCALLTNPSFSRACIECRMGWGDMLDMPFELVTTMENSTRCKPSADYYLASIAKMGLEPQEVLMVGNDPRRDFPSPDCGIQTAYVGNGTPVRATWAGSMAKFADSFNEIEERFYERREQAAAANAHASNV
ncbi:HAD family hydrolase [Collinsella tanakaei]|uniref:HAD family hydrolase n=1 Tax=Collinsella tanakaei TaxID=626935 RepID=UPI00241C31C6|nr:HAD family hydrolase [Collinsella tanakaei]